MFPCAIMDLGGSCRTECSGSDAAAERAEYFYCEDGDIGAGKRDDRAGQKSTIMHTISNHVYAVSFIFFIQTRFFKTTAAVFVKCLSFD